jgi:hypothetical protein
MSVFPEASGPTSLCFTQLQRPSGEKRREDQQLENLAQLMRIKEGSNTTPPGALLPYTWEEWNENRVLSWSCTSGEMGRRAHLLTQEGAACMEEEMGVSRAERHWDRFGLECPKAKQYWSWTGLLWRPREGS